jgi:hypothetical protein
MTAARLGPASAMSVKNPRKPSAVQATPRTTSESSAVSEGISVGGDASAAGVSATAPIANPAATGPSDGRSASVRCTISVPPA